MRNESKKEERREKMGRKVMERGDKEIELRKGRWKEMENNTMEGRPKIEERVS